MDGGGANALRLLGQAMPPPCGRPVRLAGRCLRRLKAVENLGGKGGRAVSFCGDRPLCGRWRFVGLLGGGLGDVFAAKVADIL